MAIKKVQTGLRLEETALQKITFIAKKRKRSINAEVELSVEKTIEEFEAEHGAIPVDLEAD